MIKQEGMALKERERERKGKKKKVAFHYIRKKFFSSEDGEALEKVAQRSCGCLEVFKARFDGALCNLI